MFLVVVFVCISTVETIQTIVCSVQFGSERSKGRVVKVEEEKEDPQLLLNSSMFESIRNALISCVQ